MAKNVVTLYIDDTSLGLLEAKGKRVKKWASLPLEPGLVWDGVVLNEAGLATEIKEFLRAQEVSAGKVIVGLSGLHCLSRVVTVPNLSKDMLAKAVSQEAERTLPVPLEQLYLSWQVISTSKEAMQVFVAGLPRNAADSMVKTLRQAGVNPYLMDLKPLALTRVVQEATAIIVDIQTNEFDLVIMVDGVPHPIRTVPFPSEALSLEEKSVVVKGELERTIKFYNSSYSEKPLESSVPIFISGELADNPELWCSALEELGYPVSLLASPLKCPKNFTENQYMVNIGLALKKLSPGRKAHPSLVNLNVLPEVYQSKPISLTIAKVLAVPGVIGVAIGLLVPLGMLIQSTAADTASLQVQLDVTRNLIQQKHTQQQLLEKEISSLGARVAKLEAPINNFTTVFDDFGRYQEIVNGDLQITISTMPSATDLSKITHSSNTLTIKGTAPSETEVLEYADSLRASDRFSLVTVSSLRRTEDGMFFTLTLIAEE